MIRTHATPEEEILHLRRANAALLEACRLAVSIGEMLDAPDDANQRIYLGKTTIRTIRAAIATAEKGPSDG